MTTATRPAWLALIPTDAVTTVEPADPAPCEVCGRTCRARTDGRHAHPVCIRRAAAEAEGGAS